MGDYMSVYYALTLAISFAGLGLTALGMYLAYRKCKCKKDDTKQK